MATDPTPPVVLPEVVLPPFPGLKMTGLTGSEPVGHSRYCLDPELVPFDPAATYRLWFELFVGTTGYRDTAIRCEPVMAAARSDGNVPGWSVAQLMLAQQQLIPEGLRGTNLYFFGSTMREGQIALYLQYAPHENKWGSNLIHWPVELQARGGAIARMEVVSG